MTQIVIATSTAPIKNKDGIARLWLEGQKLRTANFAEGTRYNVEFRKGVLCITANPEGKYKVSKRRMGDSSKPIIDQCNQNIAKWFGVGTKLTALVRKGRIMIRRATQAVRVMQREARVLRKLYLGQPLTVVSMFHGAGVLDRAIHDGFGRAGIKLETTAVCELESDYLDASLNANPQLFTKNTVLFNGPIQNFELGNAGTADVATIGMPCVGAAPCGKARNGITHAESHPAAGALFFSAMDWVRKFQPAITVIECVTQYRQTASMEVVRSLLSSWGYMVVETNLNGCEYGALENRDRMVAIGISKGLQELGEFSLDQIKPLRAKPAKLSDALDAVAENDPVWTIHKYLETKEVEDKKNKKGFLRQHFTGEEPYINTITRGYARIRSTDPHIKHPSKPRYTRLLTPEEHQRVKGLPEGWVAATGLAVSRAHEVLGQSVIYPVFEAVGLAAANLLNRAATRAQTANLQNDAPAMMAA